MLFTINLEIAYTPISRDIDAVMEIVKKRYTSNNLLADLIKEMNIGGFRAFFSLPINSTVKSAAKLKPFKNEADLVEYLSKSLSFSQCGNPILGGVVFASKALKPNNTIDYTIRLSNTKRRYKDGFSGQYLPWNTKQNFEVPLTIGPINMYDASGGNPGYWQEGFLTLQKALDVAIQERLSLKPNNQKTLMQRFPYPAFTSKIIEIGSFFLPTILVFSFMSSIIYAVRTIAIEKENHLKAYMKVMGLSQWIQWLSFLIFSYTKLFFSVIILAILYYLVTPLSDPTVAFVFFAIYAFDCVYFAFAISTLFHSGTSATLAAVFGWMILYFWQSLFNSLDLFAPYSPSVRLLNALNPDIALTFGLGFMCQYETLASGIHWNGLFQHPTPDEPLTLGHFFIMLIVDGIILIFITWYVEAIWPGPEDVRQKFYFFLLPSYWYPNATPPKKKEILYAYREASIATGKSIPLEDDPADYKATVEIVDLCKLYRRSIFHKLLNCSFRNNTEIVAVSNLSLKLFFGQLTALLGENGAGKSTTLSILTGVAMPTNGTAYVDGLNIRNDLPEIRTRLGLCPQYNILFNGLTVLEHLQFFCKLKDRSWNKLDAMHLIEKLKIEQKADSYARHLSGGQKRKLSLAIALIGGSEIVFLDEPTSGMDPDARNETWSLLQIEKMNRTILLTTHHMDEADILGDRIAIMAHGELQCCGSNLYLKKHYGVGYHLTVVYQHAKSDEANNSMQILKTLKLLRNYCPQTVVQRANGFEATFLLAAEHRQKFPQLFHDLESNTKSIGISTFGVSVTTMEEVFLRVYEEANERRAKSNSLPAMTNGTLKHGNDEKNDSLVKELKCDRFLTGFAASRQHLRAMYTKRCIYFFRKRTLFIPQLLIPVIYMALLVWASTVVPTPRTQPSLSIDMKPYTSKRVIANLYVENATITRYNRTLPTLISDTMKIWSNSYPYLITRTNDVIFSIIKATDKEKSRSFGLHNPVAYRQIEERFSAKQNLVAMFDNYGLATPPLAINILDTAILQMATGQNISIHVSNHPLPPTASDDLKNNNAITGPAFMLGGAVIVSMSLAASGYANFIIYERKTRSKHMQMMCGLRLWIYWITAFTWDYLCFLLPTGLFMAIYALFNVQEYIARSEVAWSLVLVMLLYAWAEIPFVYLFSFLFQSPPKGYTIIVLYNIITGMIGSIAVPIIKETSKSEQIEYTWRMIFAFLFPTYNLCSCFSTVYSNEFIREACSSIDCSISEFKESVKGCCGDANDRLYVNNMLSSTSRMGIEYMIIFFVIHGFIYWIAIAVVEVDLSRILRRYQSLLVMKLMKHDQVIIEKSSTTSTDEGSDVASEALSVSVIKEDAAAVIVRKLKKCYGEFEAVKEISFHVQPSECFGLLGVNGAGKTSTFKILTGEDKLTAGDAFINGFSVSKQWRETCKSTGYCPQFDAHIEEMTGEESLLMFARLRGIHYDDLESHVNAIINAVAISDCAKNIIRTYSGGNKRRLSLGIALLSLPRVLLLDEPTTGVDPKARRMVWDVLSKVRQQGSALILTSHSMEECEALCTQIAIMVDGRFRCLGSAQHLKSRFGCGYSLTLRLRNQVAVNLAKKLVASAFAGSTLKGEHTLLLKYELIADKMDKWASLFEKVERIVNKTDAADYSLSQTTLDQVFLDFSHSRMIKHATTSDHEISEDDECLALQILSN